MAKDNEQTAAIQADDPAAAFQAAHEAEVAALLNRGYKSGQETKRARSRAHAEFLIRAGIASVR